MRRQSTRTCVGSVCPGRSRCGGKASILPITKRLWPSSKRRGWSIRASRAAAKSPPWSRISTGSGWPRDPDGAPIYPGRARKLSAAERKRRREAGEPFALRLAMDAAVARAGVLTWTETGAGPHGQTGLITAAPQMWGDVVLARKEVPTSYHLSAVARRCAAGRDRRGARPGSVLVDQHSPAVAGAARPAGAGLSSSQAHSRRRRPASCRNRRRRRACANCAPAGASRATSGAWSGLAASGSLTQKLASLKPILGWFCSNALPCHGAVGSHGATGRG